MEANTRLNADGLAYSPSSEEYQKTMDEVILPYLKQREQAHTIPGAGGRPIRAYTYQAEHPRGSALVVHGFTENAFKFSELIYSLVQNGYNVCAYDHRGHGDSWRDPEISDKSLTHVDRFSDYVEDMGAVLQAQNAFLIRPRMLFCHSMGGAVSALYLEGHPRAFDKAVFCAPMIQANFGGLLVSVTKHLCRQARRFRRGKARVFVSRPYSGPEDFDTSCCTGRARFDWYDRVKQATPNFWNNGPTYDWTMQSAGVTKEILRAGAPEGIRIPVLLFTAENDNQVMPNPQEAFIARVPNGRRELVKNTKHEIYRAEDEILFPWWHKILEFYND